MRVWPRRFILFGLTPVLADEPADRLFDGVLLSMLFLQAWAECVLVIVASLPMDQWGLHEGNRILPRGFRQPCNA